MDDLEDSCLADAVDPSQLHLGKITGSDGSHICFGDLGGVVCFADGHKATLKRFGYVLGLGVKMQVSRLDADLTVTGVQDKKTIVNRPVVDAIRHTVSKTADPSFTLSCVNDPVSMVADVSRPVPALIKRWHNPVNMRKSRWRVVGHVPAKNLYLIKPARAREGDLRGWVAMSIPAHVVATTPPHTVDGSVASGNRTGHVFYSSEATCFAG